MITKPPRIPLRALGQGRKASRWHGQHKCKAQQETLSPQRLTLTCHKQPVSRRIKQITRVATAAIAGVISTFTSTRPTMSNLSPVMPSVDPPANPNHPNWRAHPRRYHFPLQRRNSAPTSTYPQQENANGGRHSTLLFNRSGLPLAIRVCREAPFPGP